MTVCKYFNNIYPQKSKKYAYLQNDDCKSYNFAPILYV